MEQELVRRSGRDESIWVVTHLHMEAMVRIYYCLCLLVNKIRDKGRTGSAWKQGGWGVKEGAGGGGRNGPMYARVNK
jgi:hypothetical protein